MSDCYWTLMRRNQVDIEILFIVITYYTFGVIPMAVIAASNNTFNVYRHTHSFNKIKNINSST